VLPPQHFSRTDESYKKFKSGRLVSEPRFATDTRNRNGKGYNAIMLQIRQHGQHRRVNNGLIILQYSVSGIIWLDIW